MKPRTAAAVAGGFVLGWAAAVVQGLIGSKFQGPIVRRLILKYGPSGISDDKRARILDGDDRHDVLPTDDELATEAKDYEWPRYPNLEPVCRARSEWNYFCSRPAQHEGIHVAEGPSPGEIYDSWYV